MTKKEMVKAILESLPDEFQKDTASRLRIESVLEAHGNVAAAELLGGGEITIQNVGKLKVRNTQARKGHNPRTGETIEIPAGRKVVFVPFGEFREAL